MHKDDKIHLSEVVLRHTQTMLSKKKKKNRKHVVFSVVALEHLASAQQCAVPPSVQLA